LENKQKGTLPLAEIIKKYPNPGEELITLLQEIQEEYGYLPQTELLDLSKQTGIPPATLSGIVTFYTQFRLTPLGKYRVLVCMGTACHVNGAHTIAEEVERVLEVKEGDVTPDGLFSWEKVACLGCCSLSPVITVNGKAYGKLTGNAVELLIRQLRQAEAQGGAL